MYNDMISTLEDMRKIKRQMSEKGYAVVSGSDKESTGTSINLLGYLTAAFCNGIETLRWKVYEPVRCCPGDLPPTWNCLLIVARGIAMCLTNSFTKPLKKWLLPRTG